MQRAAVVVMLACACSHGSDAPPPAKQQPAPPPADARAIDAAVAVPDAPPPKWGTSFSAPATEKRVLELLAMLAAQKGEPLAPVVVIGPGLWQALLELDNQNKRPQLGKLGTPSKVMLPNGTDHPQMLEMRTFTTTKDVHRLAHDPTMVKMATVLASAHARPANDAERQLLYALVPFEIAKEPVTIVDAGGSIRLLVLLEDDKVSWIDAPTEYGEQ